jgi:hypothetical protein
MNGSRNAGRGRGDRWRWFKRQRSSDGCFHATGEGTVDKSLQCMEKSVVPDSDSSEHADGAQLSGSSGEQG